MDIQTILVFACASVAVGGIAWALVLPRMTGELRAEKRRDLIAERVQAGTGNVRATRDAAARRTQVAETMKELEARQKKRKQVPLAVQIEQAGLTISKTQFHIFGAVAGLVVGLLVLAMSRTPWIAALAAFAAGLGLPRWVLGYRRKRRQARFLEEFPNAIDVVVRGVKAGLPLADSMRIVATESQEPVKGEFREIVETQAIGVPLGEACAKLYERVGVPEANFFGIVVMIQQKSGGSLSDTLGNLSKVLRDRKKMRNKIQAMSMEAKASAAIIGALPIVVMLLVWITSPNYIELLWTTDLGRLMMAGSAMWMFMGVMVMKKMINFDF